MPEHSRIRCPRCGAEMNRHAEKIDLSVPPQGPDSFELALGGSITEFHTCPSCRYIVQLLVGGERDPGRALS